MKKLFDALSVLTQKFEQEVSASSDDRLSLSRLKVPNCFEETSYDLLHREQFCLREGGRNSQKLREVVDHLEKFVARQTEHLDVTCDWMRSEPDGQVFEELAEKHGAVRKP